MDDNSKSMKGINQNIKPTSKYDLKERIYDYGMGQKFHIFSKDHQKTKEYRAVITSDFGMPDINQYLNKDKNNINTEHIAKNKSPQKTKNIEFDMRTEKSNLNQKHTNLSKIVDNEIKNRVERSTSKNMQEIESITGFKTLSPLPPSRGKIDNFENPMIDRYKPNFTKTNKTTFQSSNQITAKNFTTRPATTIIDLEEKKKKKISRLPENNKQAEMSNISKVIPELEEKVDQDEEDKNMDIINKFIREAFEGKDYRTNFVYYLPSGKENYYDLKQADFNDISKEKIYYTLSAKGLTVYVEKKPKEFIKLSEWIIERQAYNKVSEISFFKNFKIWRILKLWRQNIFRKKKINYDSELKSKLLFNNKDYVRKILDHKKECNKILHFKILDLRQSLESISFETFKQKQDKSRETLTDELNKIHGCCEKIFINGIKSIFANLQKKINLENNEANYNNDDMKNNKKKKFGNLKKDEKKEDDKKEKVSNEENLISEDNIVGFESLRYKSKNSIKTECMNFIKLAFIFDYIMLDVLRKMYLFSMKEILEKIHDFNRVFVPKLRENYMNKNGDFSKPQILSNPSRLVAYMLIKCNIDNKKIDEKDKYQKKIEPYNFEPGSDELFEPTIHISTMVVKFRFGKEYQGYEAWRKRA